MSDTDEVWVKRGIWRTSNVRYHTDEGCSLLDQAPNKRPISRTKAEDVHDLSLCAHCAGEWGADEYGSRNTWETRNELLEAETDPWPPEVSDD